MKKILLIIVVNIFLFFPIICLSKSVTCINGQYEAEINIDKDKINIGESTTININSEYKYEINYKTSNNEIISISNNKVTALKEGNTLIQAKITFIEDNEEVAECNANIGFNVISNDSSLKSLNLEELDISALFIPNKYEYEFKIPYKFDKINIIAEASNKSAKITGDGRRYLNEGINNYEIVVTASDGSSSVYKINFIRESASDDGTLKDLNVEGYILTPNFNKDVYEYTLNIDKDINEIIINAEPTYEFAKIKGNGSHLLASGKNEIKVIVIAENGNETEYKININKNNGTTFLKKLEIMDFKITPKFKEDIYTYEVTVKSNIDSLKINTETDEDDQVEIIGNENLKIGKNEIIIRVTGKDKTTTTYKIIVNKLNVDEEKEIEKNNILLNILLVIFIISIAIMVTLIVIFIKRNYKRKLNIKRIKNKKKK